MCMKESGGRRSLCYGMAELYYTAIRIVGGERKKVGLGSLGLRVGGFKMS